MIQDPADLRGGKIRIDEQTCLFADIISESLRRKRFTVLRRAAALPDDGVIYGLSGVPVPENRRLPLIGDADACDIRGFQAGGYESIAQRFQLRGEDFLRIVFHPSGFGINLAEGNLHFRQDLSVSVKDKRPRTGRSLIESDDVFSHLCFPFLMRPPGVNQPGRTALRLIGNFVFPADPDPLCCDNIYTVCLYCIRSFSEFQRCTGSPLHLQTCRRLYRAVY